MWCFLKTSHVISGTYRRVGGKCYSEKINNNWPHRPLEERRECWHCNHDEKEDAVVVVRVAKIKGTNVKISCWWIARDSLDHKCIVCVFLWYFHSCVHVQRLFHHLVGWKWYGHHRYRSQIINWHPTVESFGDSILFINQRERAPHANAGNETDGKNEVKLNSLKFNLKTLINLS